jgi:hypothetical protein
MQDNCRTVQANVTGSMPNLYNSHLVLVYFTDLAAALKMCMDFSGAGLLTRFDLSHGTSLYLDIERSRRSLYWGLRTPCVVWKIC